MKRIIFTLLLIYAITIRAFGNSADSLYYLLDTAKIPLNDRIWEIHEEYPSLKIYTINCPCLPFDNQPTFIENTGNVKQEIISKKEFLRLKLITLTTLISKTKQIATTTKIKANCSFFLIEPAGDKFVMHHVRLHTISKPREPSKDYITLPGVDSTK